MAIDAASLSTAIKNELDEAFGALADPANRVAFADALAVAIADKVNTEGGGSTVFVDNVTPTGTIDGTNQSFDLPFAPNPDASLMLFRNGVLQRRGGSDPDYGVGGAENRTIIYTAGKQPTPGEWHVAFYRR